MTTILKAVAFIAVLSFVGSCARRQLNYRSSHDSGYQTQDNTPAPLPDNSGDAANSYGNVTQNNSNGYNNSNYDNHSQNNSNYAQQDGYNTNNGSSASVEYNNNINYGAPSQQTFYDELSPYGNWVNYSSYGYAWAPNAGPGFTPYNTNGNWEYTSYGWTWNSGYSWGWAPFHYGNWIYDSYYGWIWIPGNQWAPAWVTWGQYGGNYGWAPMGPGYAVNSGYVPPSNYWTFVPAAQINQANVSNYALPNNTVVYSHVNIVNNSNTYAQHAYYSGPPREEVERATGKPISPVVFNETSKPTRSVTGTQINLYRPVINTNTAAKAAPAKVVPLESLPAANRTSTTSQHTNYPQPVRTQGQGNQSNGQPQKINNKNQPAPVNKKPKPEPPVQPRQPPANAVPEKKP